jgi:hypothetical protein
MGTYNLTKGAVAIAGLDFNKHFVAHIPVVVTDIIAGNTTLTANAKITAGDIIQIWDIPANVVLLPGACFETVVAGQASNTADISSAENDYMFDGVALDDTAGTHTMQGVADDWGPDNVTGVVFTATDTLDMKFVADATTGSYVIHVPGYVIF